MHDYQKSIISYLRDDKFAECDFKLVMMRQETQLLTYPITGNPITYLPNYLQGIRGGQDLKGQPPNRHLEVLNQWNIQGRSYMAAVCPAFLLCLALSLYEIGQVREPQDGGGTGLLATDSNGRAGAHHWRNTDDYIIHPLVILSGW